MTSPFQPTIDALAHWRQELDSAMAALGRNLGELGLLDEDAPGHLVSLRQRLASDRLVVAFVAEFSRGKSELINALFFADEGRRVMPATPGRTTMCPVELSWESHLPPQLQLLPIHTRVSGDTVAELRTQPGRWRQIPLSADEPGAVAHAMQEVTRTERVSINDARRLGFWDDERPEDNPQADADGQVEVPAWRHALLNFPHPLLRKGLVVIDTPGLNAVGAEPELTLGLLPSAHATVFVLAADTGVSRADLDVWRDHLTSHASERFVVLNKIDALSDPLITMTEVEGQLQRQCESTARMLGIDPGQVFPISARAALVARMRGQSEALAASRLPVLEQALVQQLLPRRVQVLGRMVDEGVQSLADTARRRIDERLRRSAAHLAELDGLKGKSVAKLQRVSERLDDEVGRFERCLPKLHALRAVLGRESKLLLSSLSASQVRDAIGEMREQWKTSFLRLGRTRAFADLCERLRATLEGAQRQVDEIDTLLRNSRRQMKEEAEIELTDLPKVSLERFFSDLERIETGYSHYVGATQVWRVAQPGFLEQFSRTLQSRVRVVFEGCAHEVDSWIRKASSQMDEQLREHRHGLRQRRDAHARIRDAESGLERSIEEILMQQGQLEQVRDRMEREVQALRELARTPPDDGQPAEEPPKLRVVAFAPTPRSATGAA